MSETYDLIVKGGRVIDPRNGLDDVLDVAFKDGRVAKVGDLADASAAESVEATGKLVTPGLIDLHTHLFKDFSIF